MADIAAIEFYGILKNLRSMVTEILSLVNYGQVKIAFWRIGDGFQSRQDL